MPAKITFQRSAGFHIKLVFTVLTTALLDRCVFGSDYEQPNLLLRTAWSGNVGKTAVRPDELSQ